MPLEIVHRAAPCRNVPVTFTLDSMENTSPNRFDELYRDGVAHVLGGFQLLEHGLKIYIDVYYRAVRALLGDRLHFGFQHSEIQDAPLNRLVTVFGKTCANKELVDELRGVVTHRDKAAHQAFLCLYGEKPTPDVFARMIDETLKLRAQLADILPRVHRESEKVLAVMGATRRNATGGADAA